MNKLYPDAASALADIVADGQTIAVGGFGFVWHSRSPDRGFARQRQNGFDRDFQQRWC